ncbi:DUF4855 domain-containing protein [Paenibacillus sp. J5C_2022]|uniref:DUF4855 domain-containing protein n=1 Tax=Paenibacillus sp. J5C2022 TaxID=2977129 RepID=UPI0021D202FF|nr:DUF4855 domain-containing protein [Paenibacillus sp. J5C2022]MCU6711145.1 DUF4855 domain-containing protein [Paenibacillus sp. J5C2022]
MITNVQKNLAAGLPYDIVDIDGVIETGQRVLTNGRRAMLCASDEEWVRFSGGTTRGIILNLGGERAVGRVALRFMQQTEVKIFFPATVSLYASMDGVEWGLVSHLPSSMPIWAPGPPHEQVYEWDCKRDGLRGRDRIGAACRARFVKVTLTADLNLMADELEVWGTDADEHDAATALPVQPSYMPPGMHTADIANMVLLYNGHYANGCGNWTKEALTPYIAYENEQGELKDWMFDGVLLLGISTPGGLSFETGSADIMREWNWYLDKTFAAGGDLAELNRATGVAARVLNDKQRRTKVVLMVPSPGELTSSFQVIDGKLGIRGDRPPTGAEALAMKCSLLGWYLEQVRQRWETAGYAHLQLSGMYWLSEGVSCDIPQEDTLIRYVSGLVHDQGLKYFWIPFFYGGRSYDWKDLGFDAVVLQPNHFFNDTGEERIRDTAHLAQLYRVGVEMECDERMNEEPAMRRKYIEYLNGGVKYGYMKQAFKAYYQGSTSLLDSARSSDPLNRQLYDWTYQFIQGSYTVKGCEQ